MLTCCIQLCFFFLKVQKNTVSWLTWNVDLWICFNLNICVFVFLQESLAVVYAPSTPSLYTIYEPVIRLKGQAKSAVVSQRPFSAKEVQSPILEPPLLKTMMHCRALGLHSALHKIGGTGSFVFLFARVCVCVRMSLVETRNEWNEVLCHCASVYCTQTDEVFWTDVLCWFTKALITVCCAF